MSMRIIGGILSEEPDTNWGYVIDFDTLSFDDYLKNGHLKDSDGSIIGHPVRLWVEGDKPHRVLMAEFEVVRKPSPRVKPAAEAVCPTPDDEGDLPDLLEQVVITGVGQSLSVSDPKAEWLS